MTDNPLPLIREANEFLDAIDENGSSEGNVRLLEDYRSKMLLLGFNAPFAALMAQSRSESEEADATEMEDQRKQMKQIRYVASLKKSALNRARVALAAHRLQAALKEAGQDELAAHLPLGGSHLKLLTAGGDHAAEAYRKLMMLFERRSFSLKGASVTIKFEQDGETMERTLSLDAGADAKAAVRKIFGSGVKVSDILIRKKSAGLIKNHSARVALFTAAAVAGSLEGRRQLREQEKTDPRVGQYNSLLRAHGLVPDSTLLKTERFADVKTEAMGAGFLKKVKGEWAGDDEFEAALARRRAQHKHVALSVSCLGVLRLLQWYYVSLASDARQSLGAMPSVLADPTEAQLAVLNDLKPADYPIAHPPRVIAAKLSMEKLAPPLPSRAWGPAFLSLRSGAPLKWVCAELHAREKEAADALPLVRALIQKPEGRGAKFLGALKNNEKSRKK